jgi:hypothetical protein
MPGPGGEGERTWGAKEERRMMNVGRTSASAEKRAKVGADLISLASLRTGLSVSVSLSTDSRLDNAAHRSSIHVDRPTIPYQSTSRSNLSSVVIESPTSFWAFLRM